MVGCLACGGGPLKPDVVFFGETVPRDRVEHCFGLVDGAGSLLVLGLLPDRHERLPVRPARRQARHPGRRS